MLADGAAALVGSKIGKIKIYASKTLEGLFSYILVMLITQMALI
jgi:dolichol kinase